MWPKLLPIPALVLLALPAAAQSDHGQRKTDVTFVHDQLPDEQSQAEWRAQPSWKAFLASHPGWRVEFNEATGKPQRAWGPGINTSGATPEERAWSFLHTALNGYGPRGTEVHLKNVRSTAKHHIVRFGQRAQQMDVLFAHAMVKLDHQGRVVSFGYDLHDIPSVLPTASVDDAQLAQAARAGVGGDPVVTIADEPFILPVQGDVGMDYRVVRRVNVRQEGHGMPMDLHCLVDATTGTLLYRQDRVHTEHFPHGAQAVGADVTFQGTVRSTIPLPAQTLPLRDLNFTADGQPFTTDVNGLVATGITGPIPFSATLAGEWGRVFNNGSTPSLSGTLLEGANTVDFDTDAIPEETSAYYHVNNIHDHAVAVLPGFTGMDEQLPINVQRTDGDCNAFYDGNSINFYAEANDCYSLALINDVIYHEYGHGINDRYYGDNGESFFNGAMNEGYADVWAFTLSVNPVLAEGYKISTPAAYIRRYDAEPKVYPVDISGEVHNDGEIIAGAWWDTYVNLGNNMPAMLDLFAAAFDGFQATQPNGNEGAAFRQVLIDVLTADDDDANLINGTPNSVAISDAFRRHGITLISGFDVQHVAIEAAPAGEGILIEATAPVSNDLDVYVQGVQINYRLNDGAWQSAMMSATGNDQYETTIPAQPVGTIISYYVGLLDVNNVLSGVTPVGADQADPNLPNYILVGYAEQLTENLDNLNELGNWTAGVPGDNNTTGTWELYDPNPSYSTVDFSEIQPDNQHTPGGEFCFFTGNHTEVNNEAPGTNDVDAGHTTLLSDPIDLSTYENPAFTVYRYYTNSPPGGANPGADWWYVQASANGTDWVFVENTKTDERAWRRLAFRVQDVLPGASSIRLRFIASDSTRLGQNLDGGSLIEAAVDDIQLWDNSSIGIDEQTTSRFQALYPSPAAELVNYVLRAAGSGRVLLSVQDATGRTVWEGNAVQAGGQLRGSVDVSAWPPGGYVLRALWPGGDARGRFTVVR